MDNCVKQKLFACVGGSVALCGNENFEEINNSVEKSYEVEIVEAFGNEVEETFNNVHNTITFHKTIFSLSENAASFKYRFIEKTVQMHKK